MPTRNSAAAKNNNAATKKTVNASSTAKNTNAKTTTATTTKSSIHQTPNHAATKKTTTANSAPSPSATSLGSSTKTPTVIPSTAAKTSAGKAAANSGGAPVVSPEAAAAAAAVTPAVKAPNHSTTDTPNAATPAATTATPLRGKIRHAAQLLPEEDEDSASLGSLSNLKKRDLSGDNIYNFCNKRRRCEAILTRRAQEDEEEDAAGQSTSKNTKKKATTNEKSKAIPSPPKDGPPEPTQYLKVMVLGPHTPGKMAWLTGPAASDKQESSFLPREIFTMEYSSKDYSFVSSAAVEETVRLHLYNVDCSNTAAAEDSNAQQPQLPPAVAPPACWKFSLLPSIQHVVIVLDLWTVPEDADMEKNQEEILVAWKNWFHSHLANSIQQAKKNTKTTASELPIVSLVLTDSRQYKQSVQKSPPSSSSSSSSSSSNTTNKDGEEKNVVTTSTTPATPAEWHRLGAIVNRVCRSWPMMKNKWYMMEQHQDQSEPSDVILQTLIERTWTTTMTTTSRNGKQPQTVTNNNNNEANNSKTKQVASEVTTTGDAPPNSSKAIPVKN